MKGELRHLSYAEPASPRPRSVWWIALFAALVLLGADAGFLLLLQADVITFEGDRTQSAIVGSCLFGLLGAVTFLFAVTGLVVDYLGRRRKRL